MQSSPLLFSPGRAPRRAFSWGDAIVLLVFAAFLYLGMHLALHGPAVVTGPEISLRPAALPYYALLSVTRMGVAYALSLLFTIVYGYAAAKNRRAEKVLLPLLDVLQSVPILSFLPAVLLGLSAVLPQKEAVELASIVLIFTSQVWNMTFGWYQSLTTIPRELGEAGTVFRFNGWLRFKVLELPFAAIGLIWNSIMSWSGGWFFLMAAEMFSVGDRDFRLPGLGSYLQEAANRGDIRAVCWGLGVLVAVIVGLDQLVWRPLLAWGYRFKLEMTEEEPPTSWFFDALREAQLLRRLKGWLWLPLVERVDRWLLRRFPAREERSGPAPARSRPGRYVAWALLGAALAWGALSTGGMLLSVPLAQWEQIGLGLLATLLRVVIALVVALLWTVPLGVAIGTSPRLAKWLQPLVQVTASVPATALFPVVLLFVIGLPGGLNLAAVLLMLMGTQWYLLFNVIAGATAIPRELKYTSSLLGLKRIERWRTLILPALFPYIITGSITAGGGAWNASIVAEAVNFGGRTLHVTGIGSTIAQATARGDYPLLLAATLSMIVVVVIINRFFWRRLYRLAEERYRME